jgi:2',3'-cyclic-nucleotide 2'-phosphodiesterase (5'-nucleotidase family)
MIATGTLTGQQLLDVLEFSVSSMPAESGSFMQVSGLRFEVDPAIPSPVVKDQETSLYSYVEEAPRRVSNVEVLDKESGEYKAVEPDRRYTVATLDYLILEQGGSGILSCVKPDPAYWGADIEILRHYLESGLGKIVGPEYGEPQGRIIINQ